MLRPRIIPCLLIHQKGLVKTVNFKDGKYVGDPINAVRIFNEKESDELMVVDIDATVYNNEPDFKMIAHLAAECRMPLCYGGGIKTVDQARKIIGLGVEKVAISSAAIENPNLIGEIASELGSQSVVLVIDVKKRLFGNKYDVCTHNSSKITGKDPIEIAVNAETHGVGEIVINSIDHDGRMDGYDLTIARKIRERTSVPLTLLGGAGSLDHIAALVEEFGIIGAAAGSLFVFKGPYKAVLINYPSRTEKERLIPA